MNKAHGISWRSHRIFDGTNISLIDVVVRLGWVNEYEGDLVVEMWKVIGQAFEDRRSEYEVVPFLRRAAID